MQAEFNGQKMLEIRKEKHLTLESLEGLTGISVRNLYNLEHGKVKNPKLSTISALCDALELSADELFVYKREMVTL